MSTEKYTPTDPEQTYEIPKNRTSPCVHIALGRIGLATDGSGEWHRCKLCYSQFLVPIIDFQI